EAKNATSSPTIWEGQCYYSQRLELPLRMAGRPAGTQQTEHLGSHSSLTAGPTRAYGSTSRAADYLDHAKRQSGSHYYAECQQHDTTVGFAAHKGDSNMAQAMRNLGRGHVSSIWAYQGSKPFLSRGRMYSALGDTVHCVDPHSGDSHWTRAV